jgi:hypothetical protein
MNRLAAAALVVLAACSSGAQRNAPPIGVELALANARSDLLYFPGPVNLQFEVTLSNPTEQSVTLRRLDLRSTGSGAFFLRATGLTFNVEVKPHATATVTRSVWGNSRGGRLAADEPIQLQATAYFDGPQGPFVRLVNFVLSPG